MAELTKDRQALLALANLVVDMQAEITALKAEIKAIKKKPMTGAERVRRYRAKKKAALVLVGKDG